MAAITPQRMTTATAAMIGAAAIRVRMAANSPPGSMPTGVPVSAWAWAAVMKRTAASANSVVAAIAQVRMEMFIRGGFLCSAGSTSPDGHTHTTTPGSRLLFPSLSKPTAPVTTTTTVPTTHTAGSTMPRRQRTRAYRIEYERDLNQRES
ncbi:MAG: endonuclease [Mycobacterium sp.]|nr:endonuclease [Mycobacterium sp.]